MSKSNECISGCLCITCFAAKNTVISIGLSGHHLVVIQKVTGFTELVGCRDFVINSCTVFTEHRIEPGCTGDFCHIIGCSVMFLIRKPVRIVEMRIGASYLTGFLVHQFDKFLDGTGSLFSYGKSHFIG